VITVYIPTAAKNKVEGVHGFIMEEIKISILVFTRNLVYCVHLEGVDKSNFYRDLEGVIEFTKYSSKNFHHSLPSITD
jgi:hypothetical protein